jgi:SAM-dependent methyltransferase
MSSYEDYTSTSSNYDKTREPVGTEILVGCFAHAPVPLDRAVVLDAGCGTGSYSNALLRYVGRIEAVDLNEDMLEVASRKLAWAGDRVSFHSSRIDELPFEDASLDGVMINQVLHHLPDEATEGFPVHRRVFREFARALPTYPRGRRRPPQQVRPPGRAARNPRRLRPHPQGMLRANRRHGPGRCLLRPPRSLEQGVARRGFDLVAGHRGPARSGPIPYQEAGREGRPKDLRGS